MKKYFKIIIFTILLIMVDQASKLLITNYFEAGDSLTIINNFFRLFYIKNTSNLLPSFSLFIITSFIFTFLKYINK